MTIPNSIFIIFIILLFLIVETKELNESYLYANVVVAHYNENLDWTKNIKYNCSVFSREGLNRETNPNKGNEASIYLEYIIEHYNSLADYTIFVHGHRTDWHHKENIDEKINLLKFEREYFNINDQIS